jgi:anionic cell wall polymer biosynthesis LytR-Cps2A-Psr (LCP) family protein
MLLARLRPGGDLQRLEIQNLILQALADKLMSPRAVLKFLELIRVFDDSIQTDLGAQEISRLLCLRALIDPAKIDFLSFPETLFKAERVRDRVLGNTSVLDADFDVLTEYVKKFSDGEWRQPEEFIPEEINP